MFSLNMFTNPVDELSYDLLLSSYPSSDREIFHRITPSV